jgi:hypothetical protein
MPIQIFFLRSQEVQKAQTNTVESAELTAPRCTKYGNVSATVVAIRSLRQTWLPKDTVRINTQVNIHTEL